MPMSSLYDIIGIILLCTLEILFDIPSQIYQSANTTSGVQVVLSLNGDVNV